LRFRVHLIVSYFAGLGFGSVSHDEQSPFTPHAAAVIAAALTRIGLRSPDALLLSLLDIVARGHSRSELACNCSSYSQLTRFTFLNTPHLLFFIQRSVVVFRSVSCGARSLHCCSHSRSPHLRCRLQGCSLRHRRRHTTPNRYSPGALFRCCCPRNAAHIGHRFGIGRLRML